MWVEHGRRTEESKKGAGYFSGSADSQWGTSSASYAQSIGLLNSNAWEEIENGALEFTKLGKRFKPSLVVTDAHACIVDCDSDDSDSYSFTGHDDTSLQEHGALQAERAAKESGNFCDEDTSNFPSPAASDSQIQTGTHSALQPTGPMDTRHQLPPLASVCSENAMSFASGALLPSTVNPFPAWHSAVPAPMNSSTSLGPEGDQYSFSHLMSDGCLVPHQSEQKPGSGRSNMANPTNILPPFTRDLDTFTQNGGFAEDNPYMMPAHLRLGDRFLTGPTSTINADDDLDY